MIQPSGYRLVDASETFLIPGNPLVMRKREDGSYHPTAWELLEQDPEKPFPPLPDDFPVIPYILVS